jgi:hypothetical protein
MQPNAVGALGTFGLMWRAARAGDKMEWVGAHNVATGQAEPAPLGWEQSRRHSRITEESLNVTGGVEDADNLDTLRGLAVED